MKKLITLILFATISVAVFSQGLFKPVTSFSTKAENKYIESPYPSLYYKIGEIPITQKWIWRFDATIAIVELNYNKDTKQFVSTAFSAVGPAIGYQHFVPTSADDPTPFNNYGVSAAFLLGENIYNPELAKIKLALVANIMQYFKFGVTYTPKPVVSLSPVGFFFGGGVTF